MERKDMREINKEEFIQIKKSGLCGIGSDFIIAEVLDEGIKRYWYIPREKSGEFNEYLQSIAPRYTQKELDKAREEGYQNCMDDIWEKARGLRSWTEHDGSVSAGDIEAGLREAYLEIEEELSKLTTK